MPTVTSGGRVPKANPRPKPGSPIAGQKNGQIGSKAGGGSSGGSSRGGGGQGSPQPTPPPPPPTPDRDIDWLLSSRPLLPSISAVTGAAFESAPGYSVSDGHSPGSRTFEIRASLDYRTGLRTSTMRDSRTGETFHESFDYGEYLEREVDPPIEGHSIADQVIDAVAALATEGLGKVFRIVPEGIATRLEEGLGSNRLLRWSSRKAGKSIVEKINETPFKKPVEKGAFEPIHKKAREHRFR